MNSKKLTETYDKINPKILFLIISWKTQIFKQSLLIETKHHFFNKKLIVKINPFDGLKSRKTYGGDIWISRMNLQTSMNKKKNKIWTKLIKNFYQKKQSTLFSLTFGKSESEGRTWFCYHKNADCEKSTNFSGIVVSSDYIEGGNWNILKVKNGFI